MADPRDYQVRAGTATQAGVEYDAGLRSYMLGIYNYMALGIAGTAIVTMAAATSPALMETIMALRWVFFIALIAVSWFGPNLVLSARSTALAHGVFWGYAALWGLAIAPMVYIYLNIMPQLVVQAFAITALMFGAMSLIGYTTKKNLSGIGQFAVLGIIGVLIAAVVNIFLQSGFFSLLISCAYVLLISAITAWETQEIKNMYSASDAGGVATRKSIFGAFLLYGSFISMFIHILNILGIMNQE